MMGNFGGNFGSNFAGIATVGLAPPIKTVTAELCVNNSIKEDLCITESIKEELCV